MTMRPRILAALFAALAVGLALMANDRSRDRQWRVTPGQVADAKASGKPGVEIRPGTFAAEPVPADDAGWLPVRWTLCGLGAGFAVLAATGRRRGPERRG